MLSSHLAITTQLKEKKEEEKKETSSPTFLNLIFLGTNYHRSQFDSQNILTVLEKKIVIDEHQSVHLIDGPGGDPTQIVMDLHPRLGLYKFNCEYHPTTGKIEPKKIKKTSFWDSHFPGAATIKGTGYQDAIDEALFVCEALFAEKKTPLIINAIGYSRGADTALRFANILQAKFGKKFIKINIFGIDPVPGPGRKKAMQARIIPDIVNEYYSILMKDEGRPWYEPIDKGRMLIQKSEKTLVRYQLYHGQHMSGISVNGDPISAGTAILVLDDLNKFLKRNGTRLIEPVPHLKKTSTLEEFKYRELSPEERFVAYTRLKQLQETKTPPTFSRDFIKNISDYLINGADYFINKEHQELFKQFFPHYFDYFFQQHVEKAPESKIREDILKIAENLELTSTLKNADYPIPKTGDRLPATSGIPLIVQNEFLENKPLVYDDLSYLIHAIHTATQNVFYSGSIFSNTLEIAAMLRKKVKNILATIPFPMKSSDFRDYCKVKIKEFIYQTLHELDEANEMDQFYYQLNEIIGNSSYVKFIHHCLSSKLIHDNAIAKEYIYRTAIFIESILNDPRLTSLEKERESIKILSNTYQLISEDSRLRSSVKNKLLLYFHNYAKNYATLDKNFEEEKMNYIDYINEKLDQYSASFSQLFGGQLTKARIQLIHIIKTTLQEIKKNHLSYDASLLSAVIDFSLVKSTSLRLIYKKQEEGTIDKMLRSLQAGLVCLKQNEIENGRAKDILNKHKTRINALIVNEYTKHFKCNNTHLLHGINSEAKTEAKPNVYFSRTLV